MLWEIDLNFETPTEDKSDFLVKRVLSEASTGEIKSLFNRINFYLEHFMIINKKRQSEQIENKVNFLKKLKTTLNTEIECRNSRTAV